MLKKTALLVLLLAGIFPYAGTAWATAECCCEPLTCTFVPSFWGKMFKVPEKDVVIDDCYYWEDEKSWQCDERLVCIAEIFAQDPLAAGKYDFQNIIVDGLCNLRFSDEECAVEHVLGTGNPGIAALRQFRDDVLQGTHRGRRLIDAYYRYEDDLLEAFAGDPLLMLHAAGMLEKIIRRLNRNPGGGPELYADDITGDAAILIDELERKSANHKFKRMLRRIKSDLKTKTLF
jgi:hypothetical protein